jgi:Rrf2 family cysteine metabolism transcriptional repressor
MLNLALKYGKGPILLKDVAQSEGISEKYLSQIIIPLKAAGLVKSFRGPHGGYVLAKPRKMITMKDIVEVLEGTADLVGYDKNISQANRISVTVTKNFWSGLGEKISQTLAAVTLADLERQSRELGESAITYNI